MNAEIIAVGTELLMGELIDSNSAFLASEFPSLGISLKIAVKIGDDLGDLCKGLESALLRSDVVITTGGLGPTSDDLTREAISRYFGEEMKVDSKLLKDLKEGFAKRGISMPKTNIKQAKLIPSAIPLPNPNGTAPGWFVQKQSKIVIAMPGPPLELIPMWKNYVAPRLSSHSEGVSIAIKNIKTFGRSEGELDDLLTHLFRQSNPYLGIYSKQDGIHLRAIAEAATFSEATSLIDKIQNQITEIVGNNIIWGEDDDTPSKVAINLLHSKNLRLCVSESYTGGVICGLLSECELYEKVFYKGTIINVITLPKTKYSDSSGCCDKSCKADVHLNVSPLLTETDEPNDFGDVQITINYQNYTYNVSGRYRLKNIRMRQRASNHALIELIKILNSHS
ncbi:MAG TPA: competence/damage-inducible protein A [Dehalococcoidia bacterium]|nr:competence/damage-inducible protein A [Chloroflexota bacterium]HCE76910.1 competence/damage-inducible protein A [Dehalococcoidia bacterium]|tara:strand:- start:8672 stop:9853 length:1182 start_codon:yes stop_codon:yes gene_type:complete